MRWKSLVGGLLFLASLAGCKQPLFYERSDYDHLLHIMPPNLENDPPAGAAPVIPLVPTPSTVIDPERPIRCISLAEAIAIALEQGEVGNQNLGFTNNLGAFGSPLLFEQPASFTGNGIAASELGVRVVRFDPATIAASIDASLSKFDAQWITSLTWQTTDQPVGSSLQTFQAGATGLNAIQTEQALFSTGVIKPLPTGGVAGITFGGVGGNPFAPAPFYTLTNLPARANPLYQPALQFQFEQPLLQGFGVEINELRTFHPGSILTPGVLTNPANFLGNSVLAVNDGILITRLRFDQQRAEFERLLDFMILNVELSYWNLYNDYWQVYSAEQGLRQAYETWKITLASFNAGRLAISDVAAALGQYEQFRATRISGLTSLMDDERQLRGLLGMHIEDCTRLVPCDTPTLAPYAPDWKSSLEEALTSSPDLVELREDLKVAQLRVIAAKNSLLPDLRFVATYDINAIGTQLDTASVNGAFHNLAGDHFNDWSLGVRLNVPLGFRAAHANLRTAQLQLGRAFEQLKQYEIKAERRLGIQYRRVFSFYEGIKANRARREAYAEQLRARFREFLAGRQNVTLDRLLDAQRQWAAALADEYTSIRDYNNAIVSFNFARGSVLRRNNIVVAEGPLPIAAQQRAVEHEKQRQHALPLRERAVPVAPVPLDHAVPPSHLQVSASPDSNLSLVDLWKMDPPLKDAPSLPSIEKSIRNGTIQPVKGETTTPLSNSAVQTGTPTPLPTVSTSAVQTDVPKPLPSGGTAGGVQFGDLRPIQQSTPPAALLTPPPPLPSGPRTP